MLGLLQFRYTLLCLAGLEAPLQLEIEGSAYGDDCIFIANDWHASMVPVYLAAKYRPGGVYNNARSVLAIHNLRHQVQSPVLALFDCSWTLWQALRVQRAETCCSHAGCVPPHQLC